MFRAAMIATSTAMIAFQVGGRATRDALFLSNFPVAALPAMMMATAVLAVGLAYASTRILLRSGPERAIPTGFAVSAALLLAEWGISAVSPRATAVLVYLHFGGLGALLISGFYSLLNERLDPRSAKRQLGSITAAGTAGGLIGGLAASQVGRVLPVAAMLPILAVFHLVAAGTLFWLRGAGAGRRDEGPAQGSSQGPAIAQPPANLPAIAQPPSNLRAIASMKYMRGLITLVLLVTIAEGLIDLVLKGRASAALGDGGGLLRFFAGFYTTVALLTLFVQAIASRFVLERLGPARAASVLPVGAVAAATGALAVPGLSSAALARGAESVLANSFYRAGYEVLFTPVPARDKRAIKALVDVGATRAGDLLAAGIGQIVILLAMPLPTLLVIAIVLSAFGLVAAYRLHGGYVDALARGLVTRAVHLELSDATDTITRSTIMRTLKLPRQRGESAAGQGADTRGGASDTRGGAAGTRGEASDTRGGASGTGESGIGTSGVMESPEFARIRELRSSDPSRVRRALAAGSLTPAQIQHTVPLLGWDDVAREAIAALRGAGSEAVEPLVARLVNQDTDFTIRRRIPLVLGTHPDARAVLGLIRALSDRRFEVRYRSGRALAHLLSLDPALSVPREEAFAAVLREVETAAGVWESRTLLDRMDDEAWSPVMDELVRERADRSLEHVFTLLALVLPRKPLRIAFQGLHTEDPLLRGTALEYLESSLPPVVRKPLWPYLERGRERREEPTRSPSEALEELLKMNESIVVKLTEIRKGEGPKEP